MTQGKTGTDSTSVGSQRKRNPSQRTNVAAQQNNNSPATATNPPSQRKQKPVQNTTQNQTQSQSQASTKPSSPVVPPKTATPPPSSKLEKHVPIDGFNAAEVDELLSSGQDPNATMYKYEPPSTQKTAPWAQKGVMATGKDFWLELRRQVATLQKGESTNKGG